MHKLTWLIFLASLPLPTAVSAQQVLACEGFAKPVPVASGLSVERPKGFTSAAVVSVQFNDGKVPENAIVKGVGETWSPANVEQLREAAGANGAFLVWTQLGQTCRYAFTFGVTPAKPAAGGGPPAAQPPAPQPAAAPPAPPPTLGASPTKRLYRADECAIAGQEWTAEVAPGTRRASVLLFDDAGQLCFTPPMRPRQGDAIHVGVFTSDPGWSQSRITFQPCLLESTTPNVLASGRLTDINQLQSEGPTHRVFAFPVRYCWNSPVAIDIASADASRRISYSLEQVTLYRATLHLGTVFTENHEVTFGLRPDGSVNRIFARGPVDKGPEYVAALVFYSLPRYFTRGGFHGRDPVADTGWKDRIGGVIGVGLRNPTKRFVAGFSVEVAAGVNVIGVWDWIETNALKDVSEGSVFGGLEDEIPTERLWRQKFVLGVSLDIVYATTAFRR